MKNIRFKKILKYLKKPGYIFIYLDNKGIIRMNDVKYIKLLYRLQLNKKLDLDNPKTFNEKLQWLKLYDRKDIYTKLVDKYEVKKYVSNTIGDEYIIPTLGIYDSFDEINFDELPNQFVIKCTHDSGGVVIVKDKTKLNINSAKEKIENSLSKNYYYYSREWPYKNVKPRIIIEKYMEDKDDKELRDYKFYCFDGYVHALLLATNRQSEDEELNFDYFDNKFNHLKLTEHIHPNNKNTPHKPKKFEKMVKLASKLSKGISHVRVDFYEVNGDIYFGELTFFPQGGFLKINPDCWEKEWGDLIKLPGEKYEK